jgi:hypothetical protein
MRFELRALSDQINTQCASPVGQSRGADGLKFYRGDECTWRAHSLALRLQLNGFLYWRLVSK